MLSQTTLSVVIKGPACLFLKAQFQAYAVFYLLHSSAMLMLKTV